MTLDEIIPSILNTLVDGRVWQDSTPDQIPRDDNGAFLPFVLWKIMGGQDAEYVDQSSPEYSHARIQLMTWAPGGRQVSLLRSQVKNSMLASSYTVGVLGSPIGVYDNARKLRGRLQQFSIWFLET